MPVITKEITIDVCRSNTLWEFDGIQAKQGDIGSRFLTVQLTNEGEPFPVEAGAVVTLNALKPDGTRTCTAGSVNEDGTITVELSGQTLNESVIKGLIQAAQQQMYPIGKVEIICININPATYLGFRTWEQFGQGCTLFGVDPSDSDFNTPGQW